MQIIDIALIVFIAIELSNILIIYFSPEFRYGNSLKAFKQWEEAKNNEFMHLFVRYLANWVAGCKLIFVVLLVVIVATASETTKIISVLVMIPAVATYYLKLYPLLKKLDNKNQLTPKGYSKKQMFMITMIIVLFVISLAVSLV